MRYLEQLASGRMFDALPVKQHKVAMMLTLPSDPAVAWNTIDRKARNQIRKAEKSGCTQDQNVVNSSVDEPDLHTSSS